MNYGRGVTGKYLFRVREQHVADHLIPMMRSGSAGAAKLDLLLRGVGLYEEHAGKRKVGTVLPFHSYEDLHDLIRKSDTGSEPLNLDANAKALKLKRKWIGAQLRLLEGRKLIERTKQSGRRPTLRVLCDDGLKKPLDDPDGSPGNSYVTVLGGAFSSRAMAGWGVPELSAYLAAMAAERSSRRREGKKAPEPGSGPWFRSLAWFADSDDFYGPAGRVKLPFSEATLERGVARLEEAGHLTRRRIHSDPVTGTRFAGPRTLYTNRFALMAKGAHVLTPAELAEELLSEGVA